MSEIFSESVNTGGSRAYYFDVKLSNKGNKYLTITETKFPKPNEPPERNRVIIFEDNLGPFIQGLNKAVAFLKAEK